MGLKLYEIADQYREILSAVERMDIDDPEVSNQLIADTLEGLNLNQEFDKKALAVACFTREIEAEALAVKQTEDSLKSRRKNLENRAQWLRDYLLVEMQKINKHEIKDHQILVKLRKNPPRVVVDRESEIPQEFLEIETITNVKKSLIAEKLKSGEFVPGVHMENGFSLTLK